MHGGKSTGAPKGNQNALNHGNYTAEARANCRYFMNNSAFCSLKNLHAIALLRPSDEVAFSSFVVKVLQLENDYAGEEKYR